MFRHSEVQHPASLMREHHEDEQDAEGRGGHGEKIDSRCLRQMFVRKVRQVWEGGLRGRGKYLATVDCATAIPNLSSSP